MEVLSHQGKQFVSLHIDEYPIKPVSVRGKYFKRIANSNHLLSVNEVVDLHLQTFNTSWDYHIDPIHDVESISFIKVQVAIDIMNRNDIRISDDPLTFLMKNDLVRDGKITNAAFLLFNANVLFYWGGERTFNEFPIIR